MRMKRVGERSCLGNESCGLVVIWTSTCWTYVKNTNFRHIHKLQLNFECAMWRNKKLAFYGTISVCGEVDFFLFFQCHYLNHIFMLARNNCWNDWREGIFFIFSITQLKYDIWECMCSNEKLACTSHTK